MNIPRYDEGTGGGMVRDDLGRWVRYVDYRARMEWPAARLQETTGIHRGAWLEAMREAVAEAARCD